MSSKSFPYSLLVLLLLAACTPVPKVEETSSSTFDSTIWITLTPLNPTPTHTKQPTRTHTLTQTQSPIPTVQPTFNAALVVTRTPSHPAECPEDDPLVIVPEGLFELKGHEFKAAALTFLDAGGINQLLNNYECSPASSCVMNWIASKDLTGDGVPELVLRGGGDTLQELYVFGCHNNKYITLLIEEPAYEYAPTIIAIKDMNLDGVNELVIGLTYCHWCSGARIYEWNGQCLESLVRQGMRLYPYSDYGDLAGLDGYTSIEVIDADGNGTYELVLQGGTPSWLAGISGGEGPYREQEVVYAWDGSHFTWLSQRYEPPRFRFEAVQDGDTATERGNFDEALAFYQDAIFNDQLKSWTTEVWYELAHDPTRECCSPPDIDGMPFNSAEYSQLAAYSRYRIMLLHLYRGWENEARTVYETLVSMFPPGDPGYPYAQMATEFWSVYTTSQDLKAACTTAIRYTEQHDEILLPLGNYDHGLFVEIYNPESICPWH